MRIELTISIYEQNPKNVVSMLFVCLFRMLSKAKSEHHTQTARFVHSTFCALLYTGLKDYSCQAFNPLPNDKMFDWSKLKAFADDKTNVTEKLKFVLGRVENIVGKGENAGYQHFFLFPQCFQMATFSGSLLVAILW